MERVGGKRITPVPAGHLMPVASKDTGGLYPAYKGLAPKTDVRDSLELRTCTPRRCGDGEEVGGPQPAGAGKLQFQLWEPLQLRPREDVKFAGRTFTCTDRGLGEICTKMQIWLFGGPGVMATYTFFSSPVCIFYIFFSEHALFGKVKNYRKW